MKLHRRAFMKSSGIAITGAVTAPISAAVANDDYYMNERLGLGFIKPSNWHIDAFKDFSLLNCNMPTIERGMRKFKSMKQAQRFLGAHAAVYNLSNLVGIWYQQKIIGISSCVPLRVGKRQLPYRSCFIEVLANCAVNLSIPFDDVHRHRMAVNLLAPTSTAYLLWTHQLSRIFPFLRQSKFDSILCRRNSSASFKHPPEKTDVFITSVY